MLLTNAGDADTAATVAGRVLDALRVPIEVAGPRADRRRQRRHRAVPREDEADAQALLRQVDVAMYAAEADGKSHFRLFEPRMHEAVLDRLALEGDLARAIERGELRLAYQPVVQVDSSRVARVEALLRWAHPVPGEIRPDVFIPIAEETGLIFPIGCWIVQDATARLAERTRVNPDLAAGHVSVNGGGPQLQDSGFPLDVADALRRSGLARTSSSSSPPRPYAPPGGRILARGLRCPVCGRERPRGGIDGAIAALATRRYGVVTRSELLYLGLSNGGLGRRVAAGRLLRVHPGVYAVDHQAPWREARWLAAVPACGEEAVLSHRSAVSCGA